MRRLTVSTLSLRAAALALPLFSASVWAEDVQPEQKSTTSKPLVRESAPLGETVEKQLPLFVEPDRWLQDDSIYEQNQGDRIEIQQVQEELINTIKLPNVVPPIYFASGVADIPESYIQKVRDVLDSMRDRRNVRLHLVGHSDNVQLFGQLKQKYGDNEGLSRERAGTTAEYFKQALGLPPESISFEGRGEEEPIASNATEAGRSKNRRVEVEVWSGHHVPGRHHDQHLQQLRS